MDQWTKQLEQVKKKKKTEHCEMLQKPAFCLLPSPHLLLDSIGTCEFIH